MSDPLRTLLSAPPDLPVTAGLAELGEALRTRAVAVVHAPPGTGKTTLVPPAVADAVDGRVVVTQPSRIAARAAARRLAHLLGEPVGETVGYSVRGDRRSSRRTRVEVVTTGLLLRRIQRDPELAGVGAVVLDEVHERHLDADLTLALLVDIRANLRDDLALVAMSATIEAEKTAQLLGDAPVITVPGALHPVETVWCPLPPGRRRTDDRGITPAFHDHVAATVRRALAEHEGDVLVFVPGVAEVEATVRRLAGVDAAVHPLHGRLPGAEQDRALSEGPRRRVIISTAVAESSLTVPGVRVVVDAGFSREPRTDHRRGLGSLVTVAVSRAAAEQRAGRAGRLGPGAVLRCWSEAEHAHLAAHPEPEIATADLSAFALEVACWGSGDVGELALLDQPPVHALRAAREVLVELGAMTEDGRATPRGRVIAGVPADPRLARALIDGAGLVGARRAAEVVAMLSEDVRAPGGDLVAALRSLRGGRQAGLWRSQVARLKAIVEEAADDAGSLTDDVVVGLVVALAHPDRIARKRSGGSSYLMASGTGASFVPRDPGPLAGLEWLAVGDAERRPGQRDARIRAAAPITEDLALEAAGSMWTEADEVTWSSGRVVARRRTLLGAIELSSVPLEDPPAEAVAEAIRQAIESEGIALLTWTTAATALRDRLDFLHRALGDPWPDVSDEALTEDLHSWLGPQLARVRSAQDLRRIDVAAALRGLLPWPQAGRLDELAPERVQVPSGSTVRIDYSQEQPVLAVRLQEVFGWTDVPTLADGRVPLLLHLLSPAQRPAAVTADLESFWDNGYPGVRADLRGRYPKHSWPEDPRSAPATARTRRR
ncbi:ATP-dependent helicase HrpB [Nocardioides luteus]|uniref:ATP-dependent helicase n=1 Tax=Nocardioides luteus TaxID=1844 RepID=A0ABQ5SS41_9ACTN|nr:ATP-dependent helicase HrpB [Nocardioides luteus]MDR7311282.1 ATP-dependent helicase HrpB [Nocardioides luteus]GGR71006.1 ATP-dependent helicase [Nocardioides luteus]GLJ66830.1 ATP-dependent helicase [Nocardioides luteus]